MPRFFVDPGAVGADHIQLDAEILAHIRVLRLGPKERFAICDGAGWDYLCTLAGDLAQIVGRRENTAEPTVKCTVYLAHTKGERMDYAVQKSVELGATAIRLFPASRCVARYDDKGLDKKLVRWEKIALEAAKQSGRGIVPTVTAAPDFRAAMTNASEAERALFLYEGETDQNLRAVLDKKPVFQTASLVIGPEGGFTEDEAALAGELGLVSVSLGPRILRSETAPVAGLAALMFYTGNL